MFSLRSFGLLPAVLLAVLTLPAAAASTVTRINFSSLDATQPRNVYGTLYLRENTSVPCPAVVGVSGTSGIGSVNALHRQPLLDAGFAVFEVDFKTGIYNSPMDRSQQAVFLPLAVAALKELRKLPAIDPNRIGMLGFSMGGGVAVRTAVEDYRTQWMRSEKGFAAHAAFYPVCEPFIPTAEHIGGLTGAPMIIFYGTADAYGEGKAVPELEALFKKRFNFDLITVEYPGATHGFNRNEPPLTYRDPAANGRKGYMEWNPDAADDSVAKVIAFCVKTWLPSIGCHRRNPRNHRAPKKKFFSNTGTLASEGANRIAQASGPQWQQDANLLPRAVFFSSGSGWSNDDTRCADR